jgi:ABC-type multidrug transport system ATPase subunit
MFDKVGLRDAADTLVMKFSSGMYQRLGVARALVKEPSIILLDEPTRSLDPASAEHFWRLVRGLPMRGASVVLATHSLHEAAAVGDSVAVLEKGKLAGFRKLAGASAEELREFYFQVTSEVEEPAGLMVRSA